MYVVTGATSNTGGSVARSLLEQGAQVRVVGRSLARLQPLVDLGAQAFVADSADAAAMRDAFEGAAAAWVMLQPNYISDSADFRAYQDGLTSSVAAALRRSSVRHVVSLSSWGAEQPQGTGPVAGLHVMEQTLDRIAQLNVLHLRAGYFMENTLPFADQLAATNNVLGPFRPDLRIPMVATRDIGAAAAAHLLALDFSGHAVRELQGERDLCMNDVIALIGAALHRCGLRYEQTNAATAAAAMLAAGVSGNVTGLMMEVVQGINSGHLASTQARTARTTTPTSYEKFLDEVWLPVYLAARSAGASSAR